MCFRKSFLHVLIGFLFIGIASSTSHAQILIGPKAGVQFGWVSFDDEGIDGNDLSDKDYVKSSPSIGAHAGITAIFKVKERFFLDSELLYVVRQQVIKGKLDPALTNRMYTHMIELPVTFRMNFDGRLWNLKYQYFLGAGPNVSYWLFSKGKLDSSELQEVDLPPVKYSAAFEAYGENASSDKLYIEDPNRIQLGINVVAGVMLEPSEGNAIKFDVRFDYGHSYFAKTDYGIYPDVIDYSEPLRARYSAIKVGVAYILDTKVSERKKGKSTFKKRKN